MTRLALFSDLHLNHWPRLHYSRDLNTLAERCGNVHVVCNAGDTGEAAYPLDMSRYFPDAIYLEAKGNHDYYRGTFKNEFYTKEIDGLRWFVGTLWTNFNENPLSELVAKRAIADFHMIEGASIETMKQAYYETIDAIDAYKPHVIMTHFAPCHQCIDPKYGETPLNFFFCNNLAGFIEKQKQLRVWCYGHSHSTMSSMVNGVPVISNPLGYPGEGYKRFEDYYPLIIPV